ncbi:hypothetical protein [Streptomyces yanii]|uniref:Transposase n=1 Tax=Streptomyces yanii TaxID=78510 RepID=A0ABV5R306_9ACTN
MGGTAARSWGGLEKLLRVFGGQARVAVDSKCLRGSRDAAGRQ